MLQKLEASLNELHLNFTIFLARNSQDHLNHRSAASVAASAAASMFGSGMGLNCKYFPNILACCI